ncbi:hypothetical protein TNCV_591731 [Trichonephila clavipes]|nr:hypothetical protein TNCV_591731 [Trichonephila clavipes]
MEEESLPAPSYEHHSAYSCDRPNLRKPKRRMGKKIMYDQPKAVLPPKLEGVPENSNHRGTPASFQMGMPLKGNNTHCTGRLAANRPPPCSLYSFLDISKALHIDSSSQAVKSQLLILLLLLFPFSQGPGKTNVPVTHHHARCDSSKMDDQCHL